jgi:integrase
MSEPFIEPARVLDHVPRRPDSPFIFHGSRGGPLSHATLYHYWDKVRGGVNADRASEGKPAIRFHDLRHFAATQLLEQGYSHFDVSVHLRHDDNGALVMRRYGHPSREKAIERLVAGFRPDADTIGRTAGSGVLGGGA